MARESLLPLYAILESSDFEFVRARMLPPLSLSVIARDWNQAQRLLTSRLATHIRKLSPDTWARFRPLQIPEHRVVSLDLNAPKSDFTWSEPLGVELDFFHWPISRSHRQWICPVLDATVITKDEPLDDKFFQEQAKSALARLFEEQELQHLLGQFGKRRFEIRELTQLSGEQLDAMFRSPKKLGKPEPLKVLRSVATRVVAWQHNPVFGQSQWISRLNELLLGPKTQSVVLVGPSGVGKTAIVYAWARQLQEQNRNHPITSIQDVWATSGARLVSGMCGLGMWQKRCHDVIVEAHRTKTALYLGGLLELVESGRINGQPGVSSVMRSAIDRGRLIAITECTPEQWTVIQRQDPLLTRCMTRVDIPPTDASETLSILRQFGQYLAQDVSIASSHQPTQRNKQRESKKPIDSKPTRTLFDESAILETYRLHERFQTYSSMPGQAIRFMTSLAESWTSNRSIKDSDVSNRFSLDTGLPLFLLDDLIPLDRDAIRQQLSSHVIGQSEPIERLLDLITTLKARLNRTDRPLASLMLIGPTGVGKTETAKALAKLLYRDHARMIRIDMSEYSQPWSAIRMLGSTKEGEGTLTNPIRDQPFSVVLLDEFEKSHPAVLDLLLQLLGEGRLTDSAGRIADFRNAVVILTSNLGVDSYHERAFGFGTDTVDAQEHFFREVRNHVRPELLGRIDRIIPYRPLPMEVVRSIADRELEEIGRRQGLRYPPVTWSATPEAVDALAKLGYSRTYGARPLRRALERHVVMPLANSRLNPHDGQVVEYRFDANEASGIPELRMVTGLTRAELDSSRSRSQRHRLLLDSLRVLRLKSELLLRSSPYQQLENERDRIERQIVQWHRRAKKVTSRSQTAKAKKMALDLREASGKVMAKLDSILSLTDEIRTLHHNQMVDWYNDTENQVEDSLTQVAALDRRLKDHLIELLADESKQDRGLHTVILLTSTWEACRELYGAYSHIARKNDWKTKIFGLSPYDENWDDLAAAFQERQRNRRTTIEIPASKRPAFRLLADRQDHSGQNKRVKEADVFEFPLDRDFWTSHKHCRGLAIEMQGNVLGWLGEEDGVHHFLRQTPTGRQRQRVRVLVVPGPLIQWDPVPDWLAEPSLPDRDPRRTFDEADRSLLSHLIDDRIVVEPRREETIQAFVEMIQREADFGLWSHVGFVSVPPSARWFENKQGTRS